MEAALDPKRREFLSAITHGGVCLLCSGAMLSVLTGCEEGDDGNPVSFDSGVIDINSETALQNVGGAVKKKISGVNGGSTIIVVRTSETTFVALSAICTHQGTEVGLPSNNVITCPNHGSRFNATNGSVVNGPAASPLPKFTATYDANKNTVTIS